LGFFFFLEARFFDTFHFFKLLGYGSGDFSL
jgi:hypothetical protein